VRGVLEGACFLCIISWLDCFSEDLSTALGGYMEMASVGTEIGTGYIIKGLESSVYYIGLLKLFPSSQSHTVRPSNLLPLPTWVYLLCLNQSPFISSTHALICHSINPWHQEKDFLPVPYQPHSFSRGSNVVNCSCKRWEVVSRGKTR
jgi:hypothetical protein